MRKKDCNTIQLMHASLLDSEDVLHPGLKSSDIGSWQVDNKEAEQNNELFQDQERKASKGMEIAVTCMANILGSGSNISLLYLLQ